MHDGAAAGGTVVVALAHRGRRRDRRVAWRDGTRGRHRLPRQAEPLLTPRITWLSARRQRELRAALLLPSWYRPGTRLPVLLSPYGGPAMQRVVRVRGAAFCEDQWFAEHGFAVLVTDGRGTPGRGPAMVEDRVRRHPLARRSRIRWTRSTRSAAQFPDLDRERVGIRGWSYGGALARPSP